MWIDETICRTSDLTVGAGFRRREPINAAAA
jgi:hypothetical protein